MKALLVPVEGAVETIDVEQTLDVLQGLVGGDIELLSWRDDAVCIINERGKELGLAENVSATFLVGPVLQRGDFIVGPMVIAGGYTVDGELGDCPEDVLTLDGLATLQAATVPLEDLELGGER
jgi:hypothetical protein